MMDLRILTLLVVVFGVVYTTSQPTQATQELNKLSKMVENLKTQQQELKTNVVKSIDDFEVKVDSLIKQNEKLSNFEVCDSSTPPSQQDCTELYSKGFTSEGMFVIQPANSLDLAVYCQDGWTVLQKRSDDSIDYKKTLQEYGSGFGRINGEHWLGLNAMNKLTEQGSYTVRFEFEDFEGDTAWAEYTNFHVDAAPYYTLTFDKDSYDGTAGDSLSYIHGMKFSSFDVDQDKMDFGSCSNFYYGGGGWWFYSCTSGSTTGGSPRTITWYPWKQSHDALKSVIMKIKRV